MEKIPKINILGERQKKERDTSKTSREHDDCDDELIAALSAEAEAVEACKKAKDAADQLRSAEDQLKKIENELEEHEKDLDKINKKIEQKEQEITQLGKDFDLHAVRFMFHTEYYIAGKQDLTEYQNAKDISDALLDFATIVGAMATIGSVTAIRASAVAFKTIRGAATKAATRAAARKLAQEAGAFLRKDFINRLRRLERQEWSKQLGAEYNRWILEATLSITSMVTAQLMKHWDETRQYEKIVKEHETRMMIESAIMENIQDMLKDKTAELEELEVEKDAIAGKIGALMITIADMNRIIESLRNKYKQAQQECDKKRQEAEEAWDKYFECLMKNLMNP